MTTDESAEKIEEPVSEEVVAEEPVVEEPVAEEFKAPPSIAEMKSRVGSKATESIESLKESGWRPALDLFGTYAERIVDGFQGMADGFAGKRRDK